MMAVARYASSIEVDNVISFRNAPEVKLTVTGVERVGAYHDPKVILEVEGVPGKITLTPNQIVKYWGDADGDRELVGV